MAGLFRMEQRVDQNGKPFGGAKLYIYEADTLTPLTAYLDYGLGTEAPNPLTADAFGVFSPLFLDEADEFFRYRLTTSAGVVLDDLTVLPIIGPTASEGGGADVPVDADSVLKTGDTKWRLGTGTHSGWVRVNGRTIGSATSGATERANADTQALFEHIWTNFSDTLCAVAGGRGGSAAADFAANKAITLPDARGRTLAGLDDMGNSAASRITSLTVTTGSDGTTLGNSGGAQTVTVAKANLPASALTVTGTAAADGNHGHSFRYDETGSDSGEGTGGFMLAEEAGTNSTAYTGTPDATAGHQIGGSGTHTHTVSGNTEAMGSGTALNKMPPFVLATLYVKL